MQPKHAWHAEVCVQLLFQLTTRALKHARILDSFIPPKNAEKTPATSATSAPRYPLHSRRLRRNHRALCHAVAARLNLLQDP